MFIESTTKEIWVTEDVEIQLKDGKSFVFLNNEDGELVSVIERDGKFSLIEDNQQINSKNMRLKKIEKQNISSNN